MPEQGPKRRTTQMGIGESGTRPRSDALAETQPPPSAGDGARASTESAAPKGLDCPPPPRASNPAGRDNATVEFSDAAVAEVRESVRARAASVTNEVTARNEEERARRESVRELMAAAASVRARAGGEPSRDDRDSVRVRAARELASRAATQPAMDRGVPESGPVSRAPRSGPPGSGASSRPERPALRVDEVGAAAVRLAARGGGLDAKPKVLLDRRALASAPIDHREAFLVSLIDGGISVGALVDVSGMPETEVLTALQRLVRLGIVAL